MKNNKTTIIVMMIAATFVLSVAYAAFSKSLKINGTASVASTWNVAFANQACTATTTKDSGTPSNCSASISGNVITTALNFASPGDVLTLTFDIVNNGSLTANVSLLAKFYLGDGSTSNECSNVTAKGKVSPIATTATTIAKAGTTYGPHTLMNGNPLSYTITFTYNASATGTTGSAVGCVFKGTATVTQATS